MNMLTLTGRITLKDYQVFQPDRTEPNFSAVDADAYITWLNDQHDGHTYRLPTSQDYDDFDLNIASWEWTSDRDRSHRVLRGGSFSSYERFVRAASRYNYEPVDRYYSIGFRVVVSATTATSGTYPPCSHEQSS